MKKEDKKHMYLKQNTHTHKKTKESSREAKKAKYFSIFRTQHIACKVYESCAALIICTKLAYRYHS